MSSDGRPDSSRRPSSIRPHVPLLGSRGQSAARKPLWVAKQEGRTAITLGTTTAKEGSDCTRYAPGVLNPRPGT